MKSHDASKSIAEYLTLSTVISTSANENKVRETLDQVSAKNRIGAQMREMMKHLNY